MEHNCKNLFDFIKQQTNLGEFSFCYFKKIVGWLLKWT